MVVVLTCAHNAASTLRRTVDSVLAQTYTDFVYYIVDNVSTDATEQIIDEYSKMDSRIRKVRNTENTPWCIVKLVAKFLEKYSDEDYFCNLDADDVYNADFLSSTIEAMRRESVDIVGVGHELIDAATQTVTDVRCVSENMVVFGQGFDKFFSVYQPFMYTVWGKLYQFSCLRRCQHRIVADVGWYGADTLFVIEAFQCAKRVLLLAQSLHGYYQSRQSISNQFDEKDISAARILFLRLREFLQVKCGCISVANSNLVFRTYWSNFAFITNKLLAAHLDFGEQLAHLKCFFEQDTMSAFFDWLDQRNQKAMVIRGLVQWLMVRKRLPENVQYVAMIESLIDVLGLYPAEKDVGGQTVIDASNDDCDFVDRSDKVLIENERIHICYAVYDERGTFSKFAGAAICSVFEHTKAWVTVHLLHDDTLTDENRDKFIQLVRSYGNDIRFYDMTKYRDMIEQQYPVIRQSRWSPASFYRLCLGDVLPQDVHRIIYLDVDTIVNMDIQGLWHETVGSNGLAAVPEYLITDGFMEKKFLCQENLVGQKRYFNAGVLLIDLDLFRVKQALLQEGLAMLQRYPACNCYDQDILNYFFADGYRALPMQYNVFVVVERRVRHHHELETALYHYAGNELHFLDTDGFDRLFLQAFFHTPWCSVDFLFRMFSAVPMALAEHRVVRREIFNTLAHRKRVFCGGSRNEEGIRRLFAMQEDESYLSFEDAQGNFNLGALLEHMQVYREKNFYILISGVYVDVRQGLLDAGYKENIDFVNGRQWLRESEGGTQEIINSYRLFQWL